MLGGTTYEESRAVALLNQRLASEREGGPGGTRILLGGSQVHNSARYVVASMTRARSWADAQLSRYGRVICRAFPHRDLQPARLCRTHARTVCSVDTCTSGGRRRRRRWRRTSHQPARGRIRVVCRRDGGKWAVSKCRRGGGELEFGRDQGWGGAIMGQRQAEGRGAGQPEWDAAGTVTTIGVEGGPLGPRRAPSSVEARSMRSDALLYVAVCRPPAGPHRVSGFLRGSAGQFRRSLKPNHRPHPSCFHGWSCLTTNSRNGPGARVSAAHASARAGAKGRMAVTNLAGPPLSSG